MRKLALLLCLLLVATGGCIYYTAPSSVQTPSVQQTTPQSTGLPTIAAFSGVPAAINAGSSSILLWTVANATSVSIDQNIGVVPLAGTVTVTPSTTTTYTLNAINGSGTSTASATVTVNNTTAPSSGYTNPSNPYPITIPSVPASASFAVTNVLVTADAPSYSGPCPKTLTFTAIITANGPGTATYGWERSDGALGLNHSVTFASAGSQTVTETWQLGATYTGWEEVHVYNPNDLVSNHANFTLNCGYAVTGVTASVASPVVTGACPKTISFSGLISASGGPMTVTYRWERSDGALGPTQSIFFSAASAQSVTDTWQLGASYSGWERLHILSPNDMSSSQAAFMLTCY